MSEATAKRSNALSNKTAIVLVVFGSTASQTITTYKTIEQSFVDVFPQYPVSWAYTSEIVRAKLHETGIQIDNVKGAVKRLVQNGFTQIILQSLHIMPGEEYQSIDASESSATIIIGEPLLSSRLDIENVAQIIIPMCNNTFPTVIAAHGNSKYPELNKPLLELASIIEKQCSTVVLCTVEGPPGIDPLQKISVAAKKHNCATFIPFMLISGVHVQEDLNGSDSTSWKNLLNISNITITPPLGENKAIHEIYIQHCRNAFDKLGKS